MNPADRTVPVGCRAVTQVTVPLVSARVLCGLVVCACVYQSSVLLSARTVAGSSGPFLYFIIYCLLMF